MLKIVIDIFKPSLRVGLKEFKDIITKATTKAYKNDSVEMLTPMETAYDDIKVKHKKTPESYMDDLFMALKTFPNWIFADFVTSLEED